MINYAGKNACFAIRNHPAKALADIRHLSEAVERLTAERAVLHQRVLELEAQLLEHKAALAVATAPGDRP